MKVLILTRYGNLGASSRLRFFQYLPFLKENGLDCTVQVFFDDEMLLNKYKNGNYSPYEIVKIYAKRIFQILKKERFDLLWIEKEALPYFPTWFERSLLNGIPYVLDYDDALFHNYDLHSSQMVRNFLGRRIDRIMASARLIIAGNEYIAKRARDSGAKWTEIIPTAIDLDRYTSCPIERDKFIVPKIVWIGSPITAKYIKIIYKSLLALAQQIAFKLVIIGGKIDLPGIDVEFVDWSEGTEVSKIQACQIGIMPLPDLPIERGKCGYKLIQYMACGLPVVASPVGVNTEIIQDGVNGYLAGTSDEWASALEKLLQDTGLRKRMGEAGRLRVENEYCIQRTGTRLVELLQSSVGV